MVYTIVVHLYAKDEPSAVEKIKAKLVEAASVYRKSEGTIDWFVMQDTKDPRAFTIVERYESLEVSAANDEGGEDAEQHHSIRRSIIWVTRTGRPSTPTSSPCLRSG